MDAIITIDSYDAVKTINRYMLALETVFNSSMQISQKIAEKLTFKRLFRKRGQLLQLSFQSKYKVVELFPQQLRG